MRFPALFAAAIVAISMAATGTPGLAATPDATVTLQPSLGRMLLALGAPSLGKAIGKPRARSLIPAVMCPGDMLPKDYTCCCETPFASGGRDRICMPASDCAAKTADSKCLPEPYEGCY